MASVFHPGIPGGSQSRVFRMVHNLQTGKVAGSGPAVQLFGYPGIGGAVVHHNDLVRALGRLHGRKDGVQGVEAGDNDG